MLNSFFIQSAAPTANRLLEMMLCNIYNVKNDLGMTSMHENRAFRKQMRSSTEAVQLPSELNTGVMSSHSLISRYQLFQGE